MDEARAAGLNNPDSIQDLHRPYVDQVTLVSQDGQPMYREPDLIDVWFDSGAMPYAQGHYPFESPERIDRNTAFPADFIAEGVDQTRGWFFTLHAIAVMLFDSVAFKTVVSNGLVLDKLGNKMSKRLGNAVDPFVTLEQYGPDATRWYMVGNAQPWDNLKFDPAGIVEVQRKFFGTLHNTYSFFALYANIDGFCYANADVPLNDRPEIDRWILSRLNSLIASVATDYREFEPTRAARSLQSFVDEHLSNWYVRLCRRRFWKGEEGLDKQAAYQTLYTCLETVALLMAPIAPFYAERLYRDLNGVTSRQPHDSVHLCDFPKVNTDAVDSLLEQRMSWAQDICSLALSLRKRSQIKVRQPLKRILIPLTDEKQRVQILKVADLIQSELNVKEIEFLSEEQAAVIVRKARANFKSLGPRYPAQMKAIATAVPHLSQSDLMSLEQNGAVDLHLDGASIELLRDDVEISFDDIPGWLVASEGALTVALDIALTPELIEEGLARELVNRIQKLRKDQDLDVTDRIELIIEERPWLKSAVDSFSPYICTEILATRVVWMAQIEQGGVELTLDEGSVIVSINPTSHE
jgi:isoleucyl-tRNA synthetase